MGKVHIVMGVSGSGKTTVGKALAHTLGLPFYDADDFHSVENVRKMSQGIALNDTDRKPWLEALNSAIASWNKGAVLACSALKESYREILREGNVVQFIYLEGDYELILNRMTQRQHFMKPEMLLSQFETLEPPKEGIIVSIEQSVQEIVSDILDAMQRAATSVLGIVGMGVMGRSLAINAVSKGHQISVYNRMAPGEETFISDVLEKHPSESLLGFTDLEAFVNSLEAPRRILMMIPAGTAVDEMIEALLPYLDAGDLLMDGGNSHYRDTQRREQHLFQSYIHYLGLGISGGEKGALLGPSIMVGGNLEAYRFIQPIIEDIAAKGLNEAPCVGYFGGNGAGHFVKTIHNGIEYGEMQLLAEIYALLKPSLNHEEIHALLSEWNDGDLSSFLLDTTIQIISKKENDGFLLEKVLDIAGSKGTGTWTSAMALEWGLPTPLLTEAVMARSMSQLKEQRVQLETTLKIDAYDVTINTERLRIAYTFARYINHFQGLHLIAKGNEMEHWKIDLKEVVRVWTNGCILQSALLEEWFQRFQQQADLWQQKELFRKLQRMESSVSEVLLEAAQQRTAMPCFAAALQYWFGLTTGSSPANLIQAQRDAFGAHTYKRVDRDPDESFTSNWNDHGQ